MNVLASKIAALLPELEALGPVYFFALAEREEVNRWEVILSASWSDRDWVAAVRVVADAVRVRVNSSEITMLSRVNILSSSDPLIADMPRDLEGILPGDEKLIYVPFDDSPTRRMYVFKAQLPLGVNKARWVADPAASSA